MDFSTTEAADDLGGLVRTITDSVCTPEHQRELDGLDQRFDRNLWGKLIEADVLSAAAPESLGGGGFGVLEQVAVLVALGRQMAAVPYLESAVLGAGALAKFGSSALQQEWATSAINGSKILAIALDGEMGEGPVQATASGSGYKLTGSRTQIAYGPVADAFLVPAETDSGTKVFLVAAGDSGVTVSALDTTGHGSVGHLELRGVEVGGDRVAGGDDVAAWLTTHGTLGRSAFQLGVLERALELTSQYAREREQFDRPIGSFQALKHKAADVLLQVESARAAAYYATWAVARDSDEVPAVSSLAKAYCSDAFFAAAAENIQIHGGIGFTWEHDAHLYFKRAAATKLFLGDPAFHRERLAVSIGL
jgi:alkylation response protein AidB-like acyl-CoA dehydrogenase